MNIARIGNKYISDMEPWKVAKTDMDRTASILYTCLQICADLAIAFEPFTPFAAEKLRRMLRVGFDAGWDYRCGEGAPSVNFYTPGEGLALHTRAAEEVGSVRRTCPPPDTGRGKGPLDTSSCKAGTLETVGGAGAAEGCGVPQDGARSAAERVLRWEDLGAAELLPPGHELGEAVLLFRKIEDAEIKVQTDRLEKIKAEREAAEKAREAAEAAKKIEPQKAPVSFEQFGAMDIRTATVLEAERVPKTDKLLKLTIDTGLDTRTIVSGIAEFYSPEDMLGKQICILANLEPRTIRGIESKGMILMAKQGDGTMRLVTPVEVLANGSTVG